ncbi:MAG: ABC transporter ATP-binding protein [Bacteriovoracaceae bacterium]|nr:ABC transporter ATP-binding protein [Bacteriovoracaceae bacterium]
MVNDLKSAPVLSPSPLLEIKNLTVEFSTMEGKYTAVSNLSFRLHKGQTMGIVGESGSGKSVTSLAIMGLIPSPPGTIKSGEILFNGKDLLKVSKEEWRSYRGNKMSMIFQEPMTSLNPVQCVGDQICESLILHKKLSKKQAWAEAIDLMNQVKIPNAESKAHAFPHELSGGQKQRVMIAMALACRPDLLICDEPTTALDVTVQKNVLDLLKELQEKHQMAMIFISHDLGVVSQVTDNVMVMYRSNVVESGTTKDIFVNAKHPYTKGLIACRPSLVSNPKRLLTVSDFMNEDGTSKNNPPDMSLIYSAGETNEEVKRKKTFGDDLLVVENLKTYFPVKSGFFRSTKNWIHAVDDVSFSVKRGMTYGLVGESGCGKTTLGRTILKLEKPTQGKIIFKGQNIAPLNSVEMLPLRPKMQIIFQDPFSSLNARMTIGDALLEPLEINCPEMSAKEKRDWVTYLIGRVGLHPKFLNRYPHEFSGGQRQRIAIARSLTLRPELLICDECVSALDVSIQAQVLNLLMDLQKELSLTYIFISHDLSVVKFIADEMAVMYKGKILERGIPEHIYQSPATDYTKKLINSIL